MVVTSSNKRYYEALHDNNKNEWRQQRGIRHPAYMSPETGAITANSFEPTELLNICHWVRRATKDPESKSFWHFEVMDKLNPDDIELHKSFDYKNLENNQYKFGELFRDSILTANINILRWTPLERFDWKIQTQQTNV